ncbi:MAG: serine hydrolase [Lacrimispora sp.]|uniref:serine hydrolase domain-containing protein n=1 Tax=Lacrimispora sp. TaxID=2719234 RepID=UPI0039E70866
MQNNRCETDSDISALMEELWLSLKKSEFPVHSFLAERGGKLLKETYQAPYGKNDLHRMFSITKSFCSIAIGFLLEEGRLSLDDRITDYFPEYCTGTTVHPWLREMTIRHMLSMETCHSSTTYKLDSKKNWVESFFSTPPTHRSGQIFLYDTSSSHTLAALVKKLTGKGILDYLRGTCLDQTGFSKESYILPDPFGTEMGGSGLMARSMDLLKLGRYCMDTVQKGKGKFADYLREAVSFQVPTVHSGQTLDEQQGYGYQFWRIRKGFSMYGMGGQYVLFYPEEDLIFVITADTQNIKGGNQKILDLVYETVEKISHGRGKTEQIPVKRGPGAWDTSYRIYQNPAGFSRLSLSFGYSEGKLVLSGTDGDFQIPFSFEEARISVLSKYEQRIAVQGIWAHDMTLYLPVQVVGECVGSIHLILRLSEENITVWMKKVEETYFQEFQGFLEGERTVPYSARSS